MVVLAGVVWVLALVLPVLVTLGVPAPPSGIFRLRLTPPVLPKSRQDFPTAPLTQKKHMQQLHTQTCWLQALFNLDKTAQATSTGKTAHGIYAADMRSPNCRGAHVMLAVQRGRFSRIHRSLPKTVVTDEVFI